MKSKNARTIAVTAVVVIIVLLFSWQTYGQQEDTMEGEWTVVSVDTTLADRDTNLHVGATTTVSDENGFLSVSYGENDELFIPVSDREAVSTSDGTFVQLFLSGDVLYRLEVSYLHAEQAVMTRNGAQASDDVPDIIGNIADLTVPMYRTGATGLKDIDVEIDVISQSGRLVQLVKGSGVSGWGFIKDSGDRTVVQCVFDDSTGACVVNDGDYTGVSGGSVRFGNMFMFVGDSDGRISEDVLGVAGEKEIIGNGPLTQIMTLGYEDGFLTWVTDAESAVSVYAWTVCGDGYFGSYSRLGIVPCGDAYYLTGYL